MRACIMVDGHWRTKGVSVMSEASEVYGRDCKYGELSNIRSAYWRLGLGMHTSTLHSSNTPLVFPIHNEVVKLLGSL
jgi:hypothetical protein